MDILKTPIIDTDKADLIQQYQWAIDRTDAIIQESAWTNAKIINAVVDEAKILRKLTKLMKKLIMHGLR